MSPGLIFYRLLTGLAEPLAPLLLALRARRGKEDRSRLSERLGRASTPRPPGPLAWLHGASVGEALSLLPLIEALRAARPDLSILVTSGTVTAAELMAKRLPEGVIHQYAPVDAPGAVRRALNHWRPELLVLVESELWPNLLAAARQRGVRTALVSARLSEASLAGWTRAPRAARALLAGFDRVMAQDDAAAERLARLGARDDGRLNLKLAAAAPPVDAARLAQLKAAAGGRPVLLAASTHPGEEDIALFAYASLAGRGERPILVIAPRHPLRGAEIAGLLGGQARRQGAGEAFDGEASVYLADALGELGVWFALADSVLMGGSLVSGVGGHNPIEPARLGAPLASGSRVANWAEVYADLILADGLRLVDDSVTLAVLWRDDLDHPEDAKARAGRAAAVIEQAEAGLDAAVAGLTGLLG